MDCRSSIGTAKTVTSLWIEHPQRSPLGGSSAVWWVVGSAFASPTVNIREKSESCAHPCGSRETPLLNKARPSPVAVEKLARPTPPGTHQRTHRRSPFPGRRTGPRVNVWLYWGKLDARQRAHESR